MPLAEAAPLPTSGRQTVSYHYPSGKTRNALLAETSAWRADSGADYTTLTDVTLTIDGQLIATVDCSAATDLATTISALNGNGSFSAAATASDSVEDPGRLLVTASAPDVLIEVGGVPGANVGELQFYNPREILSEVTAADNVDDTDAYHHRLGPTGN